MRRFAPLLLAAGLSLMCNAQPKHPESKCLEVAVYVDDNILDSSLPAIELSVKDALARFEDKIDLSVKLKGFFLSFKHSFKGKWDSDDSTSDSFRRIREFKNEIKGRADLYIGITGQPLHLVYAKDDGSEIHLPLGGVVENVLSRYNLVRYTNINTAHDLEIFTAIIMHELGHNLGLSHRVSGDALMSPEADTFALNLNDAEMSIVADNYLSFLAYKNTPPKKKKLPLILSPLEDTILDVKGMFTFNGLVGDVPRYLLYENSRDHFCSAKESKPVSETVKVYVSGSGSLSFEIQHTPIEEDDIPACTEEVLDFVEEISIASPESDAVLVYTAYEKAFILDKEKKDLELAGYNTTIINVSSDYLKKYATRVLMTAAEKSFFPRERGERLLNIYGNALHKKKSLFEALVEY